MSLHCLPFCLHLSSSLTPAHMGSWPPGCELLGGRPSINVKCCCPPLRSGPCLHPPALASPVKPEALVHTSGLSPSPASTQTVGAVTRVVFIRRLLRRRGLRGRIGGGGVPGPAAGFGDLLELGARSGRPRRVCGQSRAVRGSVGCGPPLVAFLRGGEQGQGVGGAASPGVSGQVSGQHTAGQTLLTGPGQGGRQVPSGWKAEDSESLLLRGRGRGRGEG